MRKKLSVLVAGVALFLGGIVAANAGQGNTPGPVPGDEVIVSGCVIRFPTEVTGQPQIHANDSHTCAGVQRVGIAANGRMRVVQDTADWQTYPIISAVAQADETLAKRGIIVGGPSGGNATSEYQFYDTKLGRELNLKKKSDRMRIAGNASNVWLTWVHVNNNRR